MEINRQALKILADINIDAQFIHQNGSQLFNYNTLTPEQFAEKSAHVRMCISDIINELNSLSTLIPVQN
jgi:hypothetical protein